MKIDTKQNYEFRLVKPHSGVHVLFNKATVWDKEKNRLRDIALTINESSPYKDEQTEHAIPSNELIQFRSGVLIVSGKEEAKIRYLLAHDGNAEKGNDIAPSSKGMRFRWKLVDEEAWYKESVKSRKLILDLSLKAHEATVAELKEFLVSTYNYQVKTAKKDELLDEVLARIQREPEVFQNNFNTSNTKLKSKLLELFKATTLINNKGVVIWKDGGVQVGEFKGITDSKVADDMITWIAKDSKEAKDFESRLATL